MRDFALAEFSRTIDDLSAVTVEPGEGSPEVVATRYFIALRHVLEHVVEDREAYRSLFGSSTRGVFRSALEAPLRARARLAIEVWTREGVPGVPSDEPGIAEAAAYIAAGLAGAIEVWALNDENDAEAAAVRFASLMPRWWPEPAGEH